MAVLFAFFKLIEVGFKYMTSKGNVNVVAFASKSFKDILIGMLILFGSYLILNTINPELTIIPNLSSINKVPGGLEIDSSSWENSTWEKNLSSGVQWTTLLAVNSAWKNTPDSRNAASDLADGKASLTIEKIIAYMLDNRNKWLSENCSQSVEFGPIVTGHLSDPNNPSNDTYKGPNGDGKSCHQTGHAVDLVIFQKNSPNTPSVSCMKNARTWLINNFSGQINVCDETNVSGVTPHIHIEDSSCPIGPSC